MLGTTGSGGSGRSASGTGVCLAGAALTASTGVVAGSAAGTAPDAGIDVSETVANGVLGAPEDSEEEADG